MTPNSTAPIVLPVNAPSSPAPPMILIDDLLVARARDVDQVPLLSFAKSERGVTDFEHFTGKDLDRFVDHAAKYYISKGLAINHERNKCVAQLGPTDIVYITTFFALSRLGYTVLCLSPRLAPNACASLLQECKAVALVPGNTQQMDQLASKAREIWPLDVVETVSREHFDIPASEEARFVRVSVDRESEKHWTCCVLHSSGTTGNPKPIHLPHRRLMTQIPTSPDRRELNTFPMFHGYGNFLLLHGCMNKKSMYMCNPNLPLTAEYIVKIIEHVQPEVLHAVPYTVELLALSERGIEAMKSCRRVVFSGSGCPDDLGHSLVEKGVNLESVWGATEMGVLGNSFNRRPGDNAWDYIRVPKPINDHILFRHVDEDVYECVYLKSLPALTMSNSNDPPGSFWSSDLFKKHHSIPNAWKHIGRLDDRLTLVNGEKVLPLRMEGRIRQDAMIKEAIVFGAGRSIPGVLIFKNDDSANLDNDDFIEKIWPTIKAANAQAESFSQISKETIVPLGADIEYPKTDKESIKRAQIYRAFSKEIDGVYEKLAYHGSGTLRLNIQQMEQWLLDTFHDVIGVRLPNVDEDFFGAGMNSLQAIQMRGLILKHIDLKGHARNLGQNIVFDMGTAARLARHVRALQLGEEMVHDDREEMEEMISLIKKYSTFEPHEPTSGRPEGKVVLLTGVTGSLGAELLAQCLGNPSIQHTYCLVRGAEPSKRVYSALHQRNLTFPSSAKFTVLTADLSKPFLGLSRESYDSLLSSVTHIIHSAWAVNFNLDTRAFETQHLAGLNRLLQLSLSSPYSQPAQFFFCSSIAAALATPAPATVPEGPIENLAHALPQGYARSKLVAEHIVRNAANNFGALARTFRIGQIVGDREIGLWNDAEAIPLIIRSALTLKALPELDEIESWLPVDTLASSIRELTGLSKLGQAAEEHLDINKDLVYNLQNLSTFHWTKDLLPELTRLGLEFEVVPVSIWLDKLRSYEGDAELNPAIKLLGHFENRYTKESNVLDSRNGVRFELGTAERDSESLRKAPKIIEDGYVGKFLRGWMEKWKGERFSAAIESSG